MRGYIFGKDASNLTSSAQDVAPRSVDLGAMALKIKPPTHEIDRGGIYVSSSDCWDQARIELEKEALISRKLQELQEKALSAYASKLDGRELTDEEVQTVKASILMTEEEKLDAIGSHPVSRYYAGKTRFQLDASDWDHEGKPITARDYLTGQPTEFHIRRIPWGKFRDISAISQAHKRWEEMVRCGLKAITSTDYSWRIERDTDRVPDEIMQVLHDADHTLITWLGVGIAAYNRPLDDEEGKR